jgi:hypothetical protein
MMTKTNYDKSMNAWVHGEPTNFINGYQSSWNFPIPDELELDAAEIEAARPWGMMTLTEQMQSLTVDVRKQAWYIEAI